MATEGLSSLIFESLGPQRHWFSIWSLGDCAPFRWHGAMHRVAELYRVFLFVQGWQLGYKKQGAQGPVAQGTAFSALQGAGVNFGYGKERGTGEECVLLFHLTHCLIFTA